jgi:hypothetical protein
VEREVGNGYVIEENKGLSGDDETVNPLDSFKPRIADFISLAGRNMRKIQGVREVENYCV